MSAPLFAAFGTAGGRPPATLESLRIQADGAACAIVGSAWPDGAPQDEAGLYETTLSDEELTPLRALAEDPALRAAAGEHGTIHADSGRSSFSLARSDGEEVEVAWGAFAELPGPAPAVLAELRRLLALVRRHPVAVLRLELSAEPGPEGIEIALTLCNPGSQDVRHSVLLEGRQPPSVALIEPGYGDGPLPISTYESATPVVLVDDPLSEDGLAAGQEIRTRATAPLEPASGQAVVAFADGTLEIPVDGKPVGLGLLLISQPVVIGRDA